MSPQTKPNPTPWILIKKQIAVSAHPPFVPSLIWLIFVSWHMREKTNTKIPTWITRFRALNLGDVPHHVLWLILKVFWMTSVNSSIQVLLKLHYCSNNFCWGNLPVEGILVNLGTKDFDGWRWVTYIKLLLLDLSILE